jgi:hypothetical protein
MQNRKPNIAGLHLIILALIIQLLATHYNLQTGVQTVGVHGSGVAKGA